MILRVVHGRIRPGELAAVTESFRRDYAPIAERAPGLDRYVVAEHLRDDGGHDVAAMTIWESVEFAVEAYGGDLAAPRTLSGSDHGATFDRVDYYELEAVRTLPTHGTPALLRLTAGSVARGMDADIQQELRGRLPSLPDGALEAYVGRRVIRSVVEIAFVSTWADEPATVRLDAPLWPEISDRYDTFRMEVLRIALAGAGPARRGSPEAG